MSWKSIGAAGGAVAGLATLAVAVAMAQDRGKRKVELPTEKVVADRSAPADNPKVEPGKVRWHASVEAARAAAARSGKPVMIFYMMGKLDDRFC
jgi:hypothetical protein